MTDFADPKKTIDDQRNFKEEVAAHLDWCIRRALNEYVFAQNRAEARQNAVISFLSDYGKHTAFAQAQSPISILGSTFLFMTDSTELEWESEFIKFMVECGTPCWNLEEMQTKRKEYERFLDELKQNRNRR